MIVFFLEPSQVLAAPSLPSPHTSQFSCVAITVSKGNTNVIASEIYALIASTLVYKMKSQDNVEIIKLYKEFENTVIEGIKNKD